MSAFCWQTLQKSLSKSVRFENTDEISIWLMLSFYETKITKMELSTLLSRHTPTGGMMDMYLINLIWFCSPIKISHFLTFPSTLLIITKMFWICSTRWDCFLICIFKAVTLFWHKTSWPVMLKWYNSIMLCWIKQWSLIICDLAEYFMRYFQPHRKSVKCHCTDLVAVSRCFVWVRVT